MTDFGSKLSFEKSNREVEPRKTCFCFDLGGFRRNWSFLEGSSLQNQRTSFRHGTLSAALSSSLRPYLFDRNRCPEGFLSLWGITSWPLLIYILSSSGRKHKCIPGSQLCAPSVPNVVLRWSPPVEGARVSKRPAKVRCCANGTKGY